MNPTSYFFQEDALIARKAKNVHNFLITNPNEMNQCFQIDKNIIYEKKNSKKKIQIFAKFV